MNWIKITDDLPLYSTLLVRAVDKYNNYQYSLCYKELFKDTLTPIIESEASLYFSLKFKPEEYIILEESRSL